MPFSDSQGRMYARYLHHNTSPMDTLINISTTGTKSNLLRSTLILAGIAIAIICTFVSMKTINGNSTDNSSAESQNSDLVITSNMVAKAATTLGHSVFVLSK
jgi:hypothetical protein